ncbi:hypothetical protein [Legionella londiniensis]|uniref:Uncharacterized protein n=2 Tax=Legionella londiniensis TaxID=45068 RepID=A0A0W0VLU7_9GAMM|nr:hypothetical protein [Legionella londiniensis]KTD21073.1 hypothetical protein Llon_1171 [Legionella londiniensis]STX93649.1 Uncharacterised protein [Legionella londiniensis]
MPSSTERMFKIMPPATASNQAESSSTETENQKPANELSEQRTKGCSPAKQLCPSPSMGDILTSCLKPGKKNDPGIPK